MSLSPRKDKMIRKMLSQNCTVAEIRRKLHVSPNAVYARKNPGVNEHPALNGELKPIFDKIAYHKKALAEIGEQLTKVVETIHHA